jgi:poly [ADP-ribose] polymerase
MEIDYNDNNDDEEEEKKQKAKTVDKKAIKIPDSTLSKNVQDLISLICDVRQLNSAMMELEIDVKRMPLGNYQSSYAEVTFARQIVKTTD